MDVTYEVAVFSLCPDLVDPSVRSIPVAAFVVGSTGDAAAAALAYPGVSALKGFGSPFIQELLYSFPDDTRALVDDILDSGAYDPKYLIKQLEEAYQNTLAVTFVQFDQRTDVQSVDALGPKLALQALKSLNHCLRMELEARRSLESEVPTPSESRSWVLPSSVASSRGSAPQVAHG